VLHTYISYTTYFIVIVNDEVREKAIEIAEILRKKYRKDIKIEEALKLGFEIFKEVLGAKFDINRMVPF